jgi:surface polysaccharide O-acyltransferase-like enzyme
LGFPFSSVPLLFPFQIQLQCSSPFQIQVFQYTILGHYLSQRCYQNAFSSCGTYVFLAKIVGVACTPIFLMVEGTLIQFHLHKQDMRHSFF